MYYAPDGCVAELEYAYASEAYGAILGGSNPLMPTTIENLCMIYHTEIFF